MGNNRPRPLLIGVGRLELRLQLLGPVMPVMGTCGGQLGLQLCNPPFLGVTLSMGSLQHLLEGGIGLPQGGQGSPAELPNLLGDVQTGLPQARHKTTNNVSGAGHSEVPQGLACATAGSRFNPPHTPQAPQAPQSSQQEQQ